MQKHRKKGQVIDRLLLKPKKSRRGGCGLWRQHFDLPDEEALLIVELVVVRSVVQKSRQEPEQPVAVVDEHALDRHRFVWIGDKHLYLLSFPSSLKAGEMDGTLNT